MLARGLLTLSAIVFGATGLAYLAVPGLALDIVGIESSPTSDFLLRTEGVPLLFAAVIVWAFRHGGTFQQRVILVALAGYYILGSIIDLAAFGDRIVGSASVPSALVRIAIGAMCLAAAWPGRHAGVTPVNLGVASRPFARRTRDDSGTVRPPGSARRSRGAQPRTGRRG